MGTEAKEQIEQWRAATADTPLQSAQQVQDRLLDLYATLRAYPVISEVEKWLGAIEARGADGFLVDLQAERRLGQPVAPFVVVPVPPRAAPPCLPPSSRRHRHGRRPCA